MASVKIVPPSPTRSKQFQQLMLALSFVVMFGGKAFSQSSGPSFSNDVQPILTRYSCNSGGCHGKLAGQNGFRLSLRGYAPEEDYKSIRDDESGRRINGVEPSKSLLLLKAVGLLPHGGGRLFGVDSPAYQTIREWIETGAKGPNDKEPLVAKISVSPKHCLLKKGEQTQISVKATYSDGQERDVTWLTRFYSNDAAFAGVDADGKVTALRNGEVSLVVSFQGQVDTVVVTMPYPHSVEGERFEGAFNTIDSHVMAKLKELNIPPSNICDDVTYLRRVMLDLMGTLPSPDEVREFQADHSADKRHRLVDKIFERPEFVDHWTLLFGDILQNRKERDHDVLGAKGVRAMHGWIRQQVASNRPWNEFAKDVLTASGSIDERPPVAYYVVTVGEKQSHESEVADSVSQAFLGMRIGCAKCHNHPLEKYTQDDYYHFIAFFSRVQLDRKSPNEGTTVLLQSTQHVQNLRRQTQDIEKEIHKLTSESADPKQIEEKKNRLTQLADEIQKNMVAPPSVRQPRTGKQMLPQGLDRAQIDIQPGDDPRGRLADWLTATQNKHFAGAMVNRLWKHFFAVGLIESVDDLRDSNPASNEVLYEYLIDEFVKSKYDMRHLMKIMVSSRTYQLVSDTLPENANDTRFYSHYYAKRLPAEVLMDAIVQATGVADTFPGYPIGTLAKQLPGPQIESYFLTTFGRSDRVTACACERSSDVTLSQLLHLQNSETMLQKCRAQESKLNRWIAECDSIDTLLDQMFLTTCSRLPNEMERDSLRSAFHDADRSEVANDLFWALLNSKEFSFNH